VLAPAFHEDVVVRHEALRVALAMPGAGTLLVGDLHRLEELGEKARVRPAPAVSELVVLLRVARPVPGGSAASGSTRDSVGDLNRIEELDVKDRVRLVAHPMVGKSYEVRPSLRCRVARGVLCRRHRRVADGEVVLSQGNRYLPCLSCWELVILTYELVSLRS